MSATEDDNFGRDDNDDRNYGERPKKGTAPAKINVAELARGGGTSKKYDDNFAIQRQNVPKNLTNRVPGISELLEADSEVVRDLSRKPATQFNPRFLEQERTKRDGKDARLDEKQDYLYDKVEREKRHNEREKLREERHRREMLQRSKFHREQAKTGEQVRMTLEEQSTALISRTNQLGTMIEELRADFLEAQLEQQSVQKSFAKQIAVEQCQSMSLLRWALFASIVTLALASLTFFILIVYPFIKKQWFSSKKEDETIVEEMPRELNLTKRPTALESSEDEKSIGL